MILYIIGGLICLPIIALKLLVKLRTRWCTSKVTLVGKTVIVTGANTGIGYETALNLSMRGAKVILACRNMQAAEEARDKIINLTNNPNVVAKYIDLSSLDTVRAFAEEIKASEEKLDILVNNAGAAGFLNTRTKDGLELTMQINYFGPFLLTILLTDLLKKSTPSRIINVSSLAAMHFTLEIDKLNDYEIFKAYKLSKLCNIYFTKEIAERLAPFNVTSFSLHPGVVKTEVFRRLKGFLGAIFAPFYTLCFKTVVITGGSTGFGYEAARDFAMRGAKIILACRDTEMGEKAKQKIIDDTDNRQIFVKYVDFSSLESVRSFADVLNNSEKTLDVLVNAVGVGFGRQNTTKDDLEEMMQINYFSPFLLTILLADLLKKSSSSRIINVSSLAAKYGLINLDELNSFTSSHEVHATSKLCQIYFTHEIANRLQPSGISCFSVHPGIIMADMYRKLEGYDKLMKLNPFRNICFKTAEEGAQTVIYTAVEKNIERFTGEHFAECQVVAPYSSATNVKLQKELWDKTEELVKLKPSERLVMT